MSSAPTSTGALSGPRGNVLLSLPISPPSTWLYFALVAVANGAIAFFARDPVSIFGLAAVWFTLIAVVVRRRSPRSIRFYENGMAIERRSSVSATFKRGSPLILSIGDAALIVPRMTALRAANRSKT